MIERAHPTRKRRRTIWVAVAPLLLALLAPACLAPGQPDPTGTAPFGALDAVVADGDGIRVRGWVVDPNTAAPIPVKVGSEGRVDTVLADRHRADVGAAHPNLGPRHGFDHRFAGLGPGVHGICVWADNVGAGTEMRLLGCRNVDVPAVDPFGALEVATSRSPGTLRTAGWAIDPGSDRPVTVALSLDGTFVLRRRADVQRPGLAPFGRGTAHGWSAEVPVRPGRYTACAVAINLGWGKDTLLGCRTVTVGSPPADRRPSGRVTEVLPQAGAVRVTGTATDPDGSAGLAARISVDGGAPDTVAVAGGSFQRTVGGLADGPHRICVTLVDVPSGGGATGTTGDRALPCSSVVVGGDVAVGTGGAPVTSTEVAPAAGHPLADIDRDAGVSVRLRDGSVLWLFGDSSAVDANGGLKYFVNNTAAWASAGRPTVTRDAAAGGAPVPFATPTSGFPACPASHPTRAMWPLSAVSRAVGARDRVTVFMGNVCLGSGTLEILDAGVAVVEWWYDPAAPPVNAPIRGTVTRPVLFAGGEAAYGTAATVGGDGLVYAYACDRPDVGGGWPNEYGPCTVARVAADQVATRSAWRWWDGAAWVADPAQAAAMVLPDGVDGHLVPVAAFTVTFDDVHDVFVMAYSPWPGFTDRIHVRVATSPQGPWTAPVEVMLPGCGETVAGVRYYCYAGTAQPELSSPGLLGLGYYDQRVAVGPAGGGYLVITVPFTVVVAP